MIAECLVVCLFGCGCAGEQGGELRAREPDVWGVGVGGQGYAL